MSYKDFTKTWRNNFFRWIHFFFNFVKDIVFMFLGFPLPLLFVIRAHALIQLVFSVAISTVAVATDKAKP